MSSRSWPRRRASRGWSSASICRRGIAIIRSTASANTCRSIARSLRELLTNYGPIFEVWHDGANGGDGYYGGAREKRTIDRRTYYDWPTTWSIVRKLQPNAVIFSDVGPDVRWVGNEKGIAGETSWATYQPVGPDGGAPAPGFIKEADSPVGHRNGIAVDSRRVRRLDPSGLVLARGRELEGEDRRAARRSLLSVGRTRLQPAAERPARSPRPARRSRRGVARALRRDHRRDLQDEPRGGRDVPPVERRAAARRRPAAARSMRAI